MLAKKKLNASQRKQLIQKFLVHIQFHSHFKNSKNKNIIFYDPTLNMIGAAQRKVISSSKMTSV